MSQFNWRKLDIRIYAVCASLLISLFTILIPDTLNDDAYVYIRTADIALDEGITAAFQHYSWATYSLLIAAVSTLGLDLFSAAFVINGLFYALLIYAFVSIISEVDSSRLTLTFAAICVLVYPQLNEYRYLIIRDIGFWALTLFSVWLFIRNAKTRQFKYAFGYCCALILAASFRAEAAAFLFLVPFTTLLNRQKSREENLNIFVRLMATIIGSSIAAILMLSVLGFDIPSLFIKFVSVYEPFVSNAFSPSELEVSALGTALFGQHASAYSAEYISIFMATGLFAILFANLFNAISGPYFFILIYGAISKKVKIDRELANTIVGYMLINFIILCVFLFITRYLTSRYAMIICLLLSLAVPLILAELFRQSVAKKKSLVTAALVLFLSYCAVDSYYSFGDSKSFVFDSIDWIVDSSDESKRVITNNHAIAYYSGRVENYDSVLKFLTRDQVINTAEGDLIAIEMNDEMAQLVESDLVAPNLKFEIAFPNNEDRRVSVYSRIQP